jgi:hypothetical protein
MATHPNRATMANRERVMVGPNQTCEGMHTAHGQRASAFCKHIINNTDSCYAWMVLKFILIKTYVHAYLQGNGVVLEITTVRTRAGSSLKFYRMCTSCRYSCSIIIMSYNQVYVLTWTTASLDLRKPHGGQAWTKPSCESAALASAEPSRS